MSGWQSLYFKVLAYTSLHHWY